MATLHLMVGLPCSGKTTYARQLEKDFNALLLTPDVWHLKLFGDDVAQLSHDKNHNIVESIMWDVAKRVLILGCDVILDFGGWEKKNEMNFEKKQVRLARIFDCTIWMFRLKNYINGLRQETSQTIKTFFYPNRRDGGIH